MATWPCPLLTAPSNWGAYYVTRAAGALEIRFVSILISLAYFVILSFVL